jgi:beta-galactosidase
VIVPSADAPITFSVSGQGRFVAADNGAPTDHTVFASPTRQAYRGHAAAFVRGSDQDGALTLNASAPGLRSAVLTLPVAAPRP